MLKPPTPTRRHHRVPPVCAHHQQSRPSSNRSGRATRPAPRGGRIRCRLATDPPGTERPLRRHRDGPPRLRTLPALPPGVAPTAAALADAVEGELDRLGVAQFHVAGYSLGARVALELATRGRTHSVIAIAPDGLGTPLERIHQAAALLSARTLATLLAPIATPVAATRAGRSLFFVMERSRPWQLPAADARQLLLDFAQAPGYHGTVHAAMFDVPTRLERITCPVLLVQGTADPLVTMQTPRFLAFIRHAQLRWLPGLSHVPISDDPQLVASLMLRFLTTATEKREYGRRLPAQLRSPVS
jgi:pimeloyl-ACP methyl ester carboxylesterase